MENRSIEIRRTQPLVKREKKPDLEIYIDEIPRQAEPSRKVRAPKVDIRERADELIILVDMPGVDQDTLELTLARDELKLRGHADTHRIERHRLEHGEYEACDYERIFLLSEDLDTSKIEAEIQAGVLRIVLPKTQAARPHKIKVNAS